MFTNPVTAVGPTVLYAILTILEWLLLVDLEVKGNPVIVTSPPPTLILSIPPLYQVQVTCEPIFT